MFGVEALVVPVLISICNSLGTEAVKYFFNNLRGDDKKKILKLRGLLDDEIKILKENDSLIKDYHMTSGLPKGWLSELEQCRYNMEDIEEGRDIELKNESVIDFLNTSIKYVQLINKRGQNMDAGHHHNGSNNEEEMQLMQAYKLLPSREDDKSKIIDELISLTEGGPIGVSITGMGGIGKTVLATVIKDAEVIAKHFPVILVVPQSTYFDWAGVRDHLFTSKQLSKQKRSLIVLDGMHWVSAADWERFLNLCREILHPERKFLITTQNPRIADVTDTREAIQVHHSIGSWIRKIVPVSS